MVDHREHGVKELIDASNNLLDLERCAQDDINYQVAHIVARLANYLEFKEPYRQVLVDDLRKLADNLDF